MLIAYYVDAEGNQHHQGTLIDFYGWKIGEDLPDGIEPVYEGKAPEVNVGWMAYLSSLGANDVADRETWIEENGPLQEFFGTGHALQEVEGYGEVFVTQFDVRDINEESVEVAEERDEEE